MFLWLLVPLEIPGAEGRTSSASQNAKCSDGGPEYSLTLRMCGSCASMSAVTQALSPGGGSMESIAPRFPRFGHEWEKLMLVAIRRSSTDALSMVLAPSRPGPLRKPANHNTFQPPKSTLWMCTMKTYDGQVNDARSNCLSTHSGEF